MGDVGGANIDITSKEESTYNQVLKDDAMEKYGFDCTIPLMGQEFEL